MNQNNDGKMRETRKIVIVYGKPVRKAEGVEAENVTPKEVLFQYERMLNAYMEAFRENLSEDMMRRFERALKDAKSNCEKADISKINEDLLENLQNLWNRQISCLEMITAIQLALEKVKEVNKIIIAQEKHKENVKQLKSLLKKLYLHADEIADVIDIDKDEIN